MRSPRRAPLIMIGLLLALLLALGMSGCGGITETFTASDESAGYNSAQRSVGVAEETYVDDVDESYVEAEAPTVAGSGVDASTVAAQDRLVIRNVAMRVEVEAVDDAVSDVRALVTAAGGTVTALHVSSDDEPVYRYDAVDALSDGAPLGGYMTVRVPSEKLEDFTDEVSSLGEVLMVSASENDVTQEHVDLTARLANLQAQEARLREFFDAATNVEEMLAIEAELSRVRGDIESMQAQIAYLERQAAMATVTIELTEPRPVVRPAGESWGFVDALTTSIRAFVATVNAVIIFVGALLPIAIIGLLIFVIVRALVRRRRTASPSDTGEPPQ